MCLLCMRMISTTHFGKRLHALINSFYIPLSFTLARLRISKFIYSVNYLNEMRLKRDFMKNSVSHAYQRIDVAEWTRAKWMLNEQYELETLHKNAFKWTLLIVPFLLYMRAWTPVRIICIRMKWLLNGQFVNKMTFSNAIIANAHRLKRWRSLAGVCYFKIPFRFILIRFLLKKKDFLVLLSLIALFFPR